MVTVLGANSVTGGFEVDNSLRFNDGSSDHLLIAPSGAGNLKTWTWSAWVKRAQLGTRQLLFSGYDQAAGLGESIEFTADDKLEYDLDIAGTDNTVTSAMLFRDPSAWYNIVFVKDLTQGTETDRIKVFVNGVQISLVEAGNGYPGQNATSGLINAAGNYEHHIGTLNSAAEFFDGYMSEVVFIDGTANDEEDFGEFDSDSGIWKPIKVSGLTFGTNGFYLEFKASGTSQNSSGLGADTSGNDNHLAVANLTAVDQSTDTCTNNFNTLNSLAARGSSGTTLSEANLQYSAVADGGDSSVFGTIGIPPGMKVYFEVKLVQNTAQNSIGIHNLYDGGDGDFVKGGSEAGTYSFKPRGASSVTQYFNNGSANNHDVNNVANGTILGVAIDNDNGQIHYHIAGTYINSSDPTDNNPVALVTGFGGASEQYIHVSLDTSGGTEPINQFNFGSPMHSISSSNADANGHGNFEFAVPSGYFALCTKNLAEHG